VAARATGLCREQLIKRRAELALAHYKVCKEPLAATDGDYALKYFLVDRAKKRNDIDLRMKHSRGRPTAVQQQQPIQPKEENQ
jgi:hypothetical protein